MLFVYDHEVSKVWSDLVANDHEDPCTSDLPPWTSEEGTQGVEPLLILEVEANRQVGG